MSTGIDGSVRQPARTIYIGAPIDARRAVRPTPTAPAADLRVVGSAVWRSR